MKELNKAIGRIGTEVFVEGAGGLKKGTAVLYPVRSSGTRLEQTEQGRADVGLFTMFAPVGLLQGSEYGDRVYEGRNRYRLLRKDEVTCRIGGYAKALLRRITEE